MHKIKIAIMLLVFSISITTNCLNVRARSAAPEVVLTVPANAEADVATNQAVQVTFSKQIDRSTINRRTFILKEEGSSKHLRGRMNYSKKNKRVSFQPRRPLANDTQYIFRVKGNDDSGSNVRDLRGQAMKSDYVWSFRTGPNLSTDSNSPTVIFTNPSNGAANVGINSKVSATFDKEVGSNNAEFSLRQGLSPITGTVSYFDKSAIFTPTNNLEINTTYTATITTQINDLAGNPVANDYLWSFTTSQNSDNTAPTVQLVSPLNGSTNVATNRSLSIEFNEVLDSSTVNTASVILEQGTTLIPGTVTYTGTTITFHPTGNLRINITYRATITTQVKDLAGNALASNYVWSFTTGQNSDSSSPTVQLVSPLDGSTGIAINRNLSVDFSEALDPSTISSTTFILAQGTTLIPSAINYTGLTATLDPTNNLAANTTYRATITTQVKDLAGNALASNYVWNFTTSQTVDTQAPIVQLASPVNGSTSVALNRSLTVDFSETLDQSTVNTNTFTLQQGVTLIPGTVAYSGTTASFDPTSNLTANSTYRATVTTQVRDLAGNSLANNYVWSFTTGQTQNEPVPLNGASDFAILAGSTVTNTGPTIINGNLGLSPGSAVTGFPPGSVNGIQHINNSTSAQAKLDLTQAYNDAAGRTLAPVTVSGNMGGQTLAPGLYKSTSTLAISAGDLTLDAQGDANAVFIFQIASGFTVTSGRQVVLSGGALASNVYWQVGTSATIGTNAIFKGNILADQSITFETGATLDGRALTRIGAVSLDSNTITKP